VGDTFKDWLERTGVVVGVVAVDAFAEQVAELNAGWAAILVVALHQLSIWLRARKRFPKSDGAAA